MRRKAGMAVAAAAVLVGGWAWPSQASEVADGEDLRVRSLRIVDDAGQTRIVMSALDRDAVMIAFFGVDGKIAMGISLLPNGTPTISMHNADGAFSVLHPTALAFFDPNRKMRLMIGTNEFSGYSPMIRSYNANGETIGN